MNEQGMSPYQSPDGVSAMPVQIDGGASPKVFGILHLVYASVGGIFFAAMLALFGFVGSMKDDVITELKKEDESVASMFDFFFGEMFSYLMIFFAISVFFAIWLFVLGVGLLKRKEWARKGSSIWAVCRIVALVVSMVMGFQYASEMQPMLEQIERAQAGAEGGGSVSDSSFSTVSNVMSTIFNAIMYLAYPVVCLVFMRKIDMSFGARS